MTLVKISSCMGFIVSLIPLAKHECNIYSSFKDEKIYEYIFMYMFQTLIIVLVLKFSYSNKDYFSFIGKIIT